MEGFQNSQDIKGSEKEWQPVELWVKTEKWQDRLTLALRVGGYSSLNTGEAWFSDITVEPVSGSAAERQERLPAGLGRRRVSRRSASGRSSCCSA